MDFSRKTPGFSRGVQSLNDQKSRSKTRIKGPIMATVNGRGRSVFTLVELLVVIVIISVLFSMLMPVLSSSIEWAKKAQCLGNLRQIGLGTNVYADDYAGWLPARFYNGGVDSFFPNSYRNEVAPFWDLSESFFYPYLGNRALCLRLLFCPGTICDYMNATKIPTYQITYQYFNFPVPAVWKPNATYYRDLTRHTEKNAILPQWGCLTYERPALLLFVAHDVPSKSIIPGGMNAVRMDGSGKWTIWSKLENYLTYQRVYYWPGTN